MVRATFGRGFRAAPGDLPLVTSQSGDSDDPDKRHLDDLGRRIEAVREQHPEAKPAQPSGRLNVVYRLSTEFVAAVFVGLALGWGFDYLTGLSRSESSPFSVLGIAAAFYSVCSRDASAERRARQRRKVAHGRRPQPDGAVRSAQADPDGDRRGRRVVHEREPLDGAWRLPPDARSWSLGVQARRHRSRPPAVGRRADVRFHRATDRSERDGRIGTQVLPVHLLAVHLHLLHEFPGADPLFLHGDEPHHRDLRDGAQRVRAGA